MDAVCSNNDWLSITQHCIKLVCAMEQPVHPRVVWQLCAPPHWGVESAFMYDVEVPGGDKCCVKSNKVKARLFFPLKNNFLTSFSYSAKVIILDQTMNC